MASPLDRINLTPEERVRFEAQLRQLRKRIGRAKADQVFNRIAKGLEVTQGIPIAEARRRYNIGGRDPRVVAAYSKQLGDLAEKAAEIDFDRAAKIGELSKKKVDLMVPILQVIGRAVSGEAQFATGVGQARIRGLSDQYKEYNEALTRKLSTLSSDPNSDTKRKTIPNEVASVFEVYPGAAQKDLNVLAETQDFLNKVNNSLNKVPLPGDKIEMFEGISAQYGGPAAFQALLENSKAGEAKTILQKLTRAKKEQDDVYKEHGKKVTGLIREASKALGARRPQLTRVINEVVDALGGLDGTKGAQDALDNAIGMLTPKEGEVSPIEQERERLLEALADETDTRGPIEAARDQFWATPEFGKFAEGITGKTVGELGRPELLQLTKAAQRYQRRSSTESKQDIKDLIKEFEAGEETGKSLEKRVLPDEPETEASQRPSAQLAQPPAVTDTVPETEDVADYQSVSGLLGGEPVEMRLKEKDGRFSIEVVKDGKVTKTIEQTAATMDEFSDALNALQQASELEQRKGEFKEITGEEPSELFGITPEQATERAFEQSGERVRRRQEKLFQEDLPDDPFTDFNDRFDSDKFAKEAQRAEGLTPEPSAPLTAGAPILSASVEDIAPIQKAGTLEDELSRVAQGASLRSRMDDIIAGEMGEDPLTTQQSAELAADDRVKRTAEFLRRKLQRVEAGTGR